MASFPDLTENLARLEPAAARSSPERVAFLAAGWGLDHEVGGNLIKLVIRKLAGQNAHRYSK